VAAAFRDDAGWRVAALLATPVGAVGLARVAIAVGAAVGAWALRRAPAARGTQTLMAAAALLLPVTGALVSHATSRPGGAAWLVAVGALHQAAVGAWVGGLACAVAVRAGGAADHGEWLLAFSRLATGAVAVVGATGVALAVAYVPTPGAAVGTSYGMMVLTKIVLFGALLVMGGLNHRAVRATPASPASALRLHRRLEVEAGLAMVTVLFAASIASAPPAADAGTRPEPHRARGGRRAGRSAEPAGGRGYRVVRVRAQRVRPPDRRGRRTRDPRAERARALGAALAAALRRADALRRV
jgi:putative copper export protein